MIVLASYYASIGCAFNIRCRKMILRPLWHHHGGTTTWPRLHIHINDGKCHLNCQNWICNTNYKRDRCNHMLQRKGNKICSGMGQYLGLHSEHEAFLPVAILYEQRRHVIRKMWGKSRVDPHTEPNCPSQRGAGPLPAASSTENATVWYLFLSSERSLLSL